MKQRSILVASLTMVGWLAATPCYGAIGDEVRKLAPDDLELTSGFGHAIALEGTTAVIATPFDDGGGAWYTDRGTAYIYDVATGTKLHRLIPDDAADGAEFGWDAGLSGNYAVVGAPGASGDGAAYLFDVNSGSQLYRWSPPDDGGYSALFGTSVAIDGNVTIVGARSTHVPEIRDYAGAAYLYDVTDGSPLGRLTVDDGHNGTNFGHSVDIEGTTALVGAVAHHTDDGVRGGAAYVMDITTGDVVHKLVPEDPQVSGWFGDDVALSGDRAVVGAYKYSDRGVRCGVAYLFDTTTGEQVARLTAPDVELDDYFGAYVAIDGRTVVIGSPQEDEDSRYTKYRGAAHFYDAVTGEYIRRVVSSDNEVSDYFGRDVAISGPVAMAGAVGDDDGAAYVFDGARLAGHTDISNRPIWPHDLGTVYFSTEQVRELAIPDRRLGRVQLATLGRVPIGVLLDLDLGGEDLEAVYHALNDTDNANGDLFDFIMLTEGGFAAADWDLLAVINDVDALIDDGDTLATFEWDLTNIFDANVGVSRVGTALIPEPATVGLLAIGGLVALRRRRTA